MTLEKNSPGKVNLLLNILGRRADGFHELETVMHPVKLFDRLTFARGDRGLELACSDPAVAGRCPQPCASRGIRFFAGGPNQ